MNKIITFLSNWRDNLAWFWRGIWTICTGGGAKIVGWLTIIWGLASATMAALGPLLRSLWSQLETLMPQGFATATWPAALNNAANFLNSFLPITEVAIMLQIIISLYISVLVFRFNCWMFGKLFAIRKVVGL